MIRSLTRNLERKVRRMVMRKGRRIWVVAVALLFFASLSAFAAGPAASKKKGNYVVGISNSMYGNLWREEHVASAVAVAKAYIKRGWLENVIVQQSGADVALQIQQIRNMINQKVDMILINPASATGLVGVMEEAKEAGIPCICMDAELLGADRSVALSVATDKYKEAYDDLKYVVKAIGGKGKVVFLMGIAGDQPTQRRLEGAKAVLDEFPDLELLTTVYANYNQSTAESTMNDIISTYPQIDVVFNASDMGLGVLRAFQHAGRPLPALTGDPNNAWVINAKQLRDKGTKLIYASTANPPGIGGTAMHIAAYLLNGYKFKAGVLQDNEYLYPVKAMMTPENLDSWLKYFKGKDPSTYISEVAGEDEIAKLFE
jgi:ribose transport system substrate-binding protein